MKLRLATNYYRPRELVLETEEECQMLDLIMHFADRNSDKLREHLKIVNGEYPTTEQWRKIIDFIRDIAYEFNEQKPLWSK